MNSNKKILLGVIASPVALTLAGCSGAPDIKEKDPLKTFKNVYFDERVEKRLPDFTPMEKVQYVKLRGQPVSEVLDRLGRIYGVNYYLEGPDLRVPKTRLKVTSIADLKYVVEETTPYRIEYEKGYHKNRLVKVNVRLKEDKSKRTLVVRGKTTLFDEIGRVADKVKIIFENGLENKDIALSVNTDSVQDFVSSVCDAADVWCTFDSDGLRIEKTKPYTVSIDKIGDASFNIGSVSVGGSSMSSGGQGGDQGEEGGNASQNQVQKAGQEGGGEGAQGFGYATKEFGFENRLQLLMANYIGDPSIKYSISDTGLVSFYVSPSQYRRMSQFFTSVENKKEVVDVDISVLRVDLKDQYKFGINWDTLLRFDKKSPAGVVLGAFAPGVDAGDPNGFLKVIDAEKGKAIEQYIQANASSMTISEIEALREKAYSGVIQALNQFGQIHKVDSFHGQIVTGSLLPFSNYELVRYFVPESNTDENGNTSTGASVKSDEVGFKGVLTISKTDDGEYYVDGYVEQNVINGYATATLGTNVTLKAPNLVGKKIRVSTKMSDLGRTIIVGGYRVKGLDRTTAGLPGVMDAPGFGYLFKNKSDLSQNSEFIVLITIKRPIEGKVTPSIDYNNWKAGIGNKDEFKGLKK